MQLETDQIDNMTVDNAAEIIEDEELNPVNFNNCCRIIPVE